jgi:hypothetical protein
MYMRKYFYATVFAALFIAQIDTSAAQAADAPPAATGSQPVIVTLDPVQVAAPAQDPAAKSPAVAPPSVVLPTVAPPALTPPAAQQPSVTPTTTKTDGPAKTDTWNTFSFWLCIVAVLGIVYFFARSSRSEERKIYRDPYDRSRPRGRIVTGPAHIAHRQRQEVICRRSRSG